jgi:hypothetical protein
MSDEIPVGIIQIPVSHLTFEPTPDLNFPSCQYSNILGLDLERAQQLAVVFKNHYEPWKPKHHISCLVTKEKINNILQSLHISREEFQQTIDARKYPQIRGTLKFWCVRGQRRALAAQLAFGESSWITAQLYCKDEGMSRVG